MKTKEFPRPKNFLYDEVFYFDDEIAIMCGHYKGRKSFSLGLRWEVAESDLGYPNIRGHSVWIVIPDRLAEYILDGLLKDSENENAAIFNKELAFKYFEIIKSQIYYTTIKQNSHI